MALLVTASMLLVPAFASPVNALSIEVSTWDDLKQAVEGTDDVAIIIAADIPFKGVLNVSDHAVTISSQGNAKTLTSANARHFNVSGTDAALMLSDVILDGTDQTMGGISITGGATLELNTGAVIQNCKSDVATGYGGGVYSSSSIVTIDGATITGNYAYRLGGGIYASANSFVTMEAGTISQNKASSGGGGIAISRAALTMNGGWITENEAWDAEYPRNSTDSRMYGHGGGVYAAYDSNFSLNDGVISYNKSSYTGGGVFVGTSQLLSYPSDLDDSSVFAMNGGLITKNETMYAGGGVCVRGNGTEFSMNHGTVSNNLSNYYMYSDGGIDGGYGGGIYVISGTCNMGSEGNANANPVITGNTAYRQGGGVYVISYSNYIVQDQSIFNLYRGEITSNTAGAHGGGVVLFASTINMYDGLIAKNTADDYGGGVCLLLYGDTRGSQLNMSGGSITENAVTSAQGRGGGVYLGVSPVLGGLATSVLLCDGGDISNNTSGNNGGGIYVIDTATVTLTNQSTLTGNTAANEGGGIYSEVFTGFDANAQTGDYTQVTDTDYGNLNIDDTVTFYGNKAPYAYPPPSLAEDMTHLQYAASSIHLIATGYVPLLNNYDINYAVPPAYDTYDVTYYPNGGTGTDYTDADIIAGTAHTVLDPADDNLAYTWSGYTFLGWDTDAAATSATYQAGDSIDDTLAKDGVISLYAIWSRNPTVGGGGGSTARYVVYYTAGTGVTDAADIPVTSASMVARTSYTVAGADPAPTRPDYTFTGWTVTTDSSKTLETQYLPGDVFRMPSNNVTLTAIWADSGIALNKTDHIAYIIGYDDGTVRPEGNITRAESATILFRLLTDNSRDQYRSADNAFTDADSGTWYNNAVSTLSSAGIVTGYPDGSFRPNAFITRAEYAALIARFDTGGSAVTTFTDISAHWAQDDIERVAARGWIEGYPDGSFRPDAYITRAEVMVLINRVLDRVPEDTGDLLSGMTTWPDNMDQTSWYYLAVQEATNSHLYERKSDGYYEVWTEIVDTPDWKALETSLSH
ncbi:MAG: S-layer homology domain-containing protein [Oscillospiraceae bacterium]|nr:S-layer homology domain-containing protein [Oscillospiraceae bacterium]